MCTTKWHLDANNSAQIKIFIVWLGLIPPSRDVLGLGESRRGLIGQDTLYCGFLW